MDQFKMMEAGKAFELKVQELEAKIRADAEALEAVAAERASHQSMMEAGQALVITVKSLEAKTAQDATGPSPVNDHQSPGPPGRSPPVPTNAAGVKDSTSENANGGNKQQQVTGKISYFSAAAAPMTREQALSFLKQRAPQEGRRPYQVCQLQLDLTDGGPSKSLRRRYCTLFLSTTLC